MGQVTSICRQSQDSTLSVYELLGDAINQPLKKSQHKPVHISKERKKQINEEVEDFQKLCQDIEKVREAFKEEKWLKILGFNIQIGVYCRQTNNQPLKINITKVGQEFSSNQDQHQKSGNQQEYSQKFTDVYKNGISLGNKMSLISDKSFHSGKDQEQKDLKSSDISNNNNEYSLRIIRNNNKSKSNNISEFQNPTFLDLAVEDILYREWKDPSKVFLVMSLTDIKYFFDQELKPAIQKKINKSEENAFYELSMRTRGDSSIRLKKEIEKSSQNCIIKQMKIEDFYNFFLYFKELVPIMKNIAQKYQLRECYIGLDNDDIVQKLLRQTQKKEISEEAKEEISEVNEDKIDSMTFINQNQNQNHQYSIEFQNNQDQFDDCNNPQQKSSFVNSESKINIVQNFKNKSEKKQKKVEVVDDYENMCQICFNSQNQIALPLCGHAFCCSCIEDWNNKKKENKQTCPICVQEMDLNEKELFQLVDDEFSDELEAICEKNVSQAVEFILDLKKINDIDRFMNGLYEIDLKYFKNITQNQLKEIAKANKNAIIRVKNMNDQ